MSYLSSLSNVFLTGNKDVDRLVLSYISYRQLLEICSINKTVNDKVCDETFFRNRVIAKYLESLTNN